MLINPLDRASSSTMKAMNLLTERWLDICN
jgi:hypothetical protein